MKMKDCKDHIDVILQLEGGELIIEDMEDLNKLIEVCKPLSYSQGFYSRFVNLLEQVEDGDIILPLVL